MYLLMILFIFFFIFVFFVSTLDRTESKCIETCAQKYMAHFQRVNVRFGKIKKYICIHAYLYTFCYFIMYTIFYLFVPL
jgi:hypothetical protein